MSSVRAVVVGFLVIALAASSSRTALADDAAENARGAMRRGSAALERGDNEAALAEYEAAKKLVPSANAPYFFAAEALARLSRWREVVENLEAYLAKDPAVSDADTVKARIANVRAAHFPGRVRIVVRGGSTTFAILIDGRPVTPGETGVIELPPGEHHLDVSAPSRVAVAQDIKVTGDVESEVPIELAPSTTTPPSSNLGPPPPPSNETPWSTIGLVATGVGAAGLITSIILDAAVLSSKIDDYNAAARAGDRGKAANALSDVQSLQTAVLISYVASSVVLVGGGALWLFAPRSERKVVTGIAPVVSGSFVGVSSRILF